MHPSARCRTTFACAAVLLLAGCSGSGDIQFLSLHTGAIDPPPPTVHRYSAAECYWWVDADGRLNVAMKAIRRFLLMGRIARTGIDVSFVLDEPPAGSGRNYTVRQRDALLVLDAPLDTHRFGSYAGVVGVTVRRDRVEGSYRIWMNHQPSLTPFFLFPQSVGNYLFFGRFRAVHDAARGEAIRARCDEMAGPRVHRAGPRPATSQPATAPG